MHMLLNVELDILVTINRQNKKEHLKINTLHHQPGSSHKG